MPRPPAILRLAALATIVLPNMSSAQRPAVPDSLFRPICEAGRTMPVDTAAVTFVVSPGTDDNGRRARGRSYKRALAVTEILGQYFNPPASVALPQPRVWYRGDSVDRLRRASAPELRAELDVWLDWTGRLTGVEWVTESRSPELAGAVLRALRAADSAMAFLELRKPPNVPIRLALAFVDTLTADDQPLMPTRVAYYPVEELVEMQSMPAPQYPQRLQSAKVDGRVELQYLVDATGHAVPTTLWVVSATHDEFVAAASAAVLRGTFRPAGGHGCQVGMTVQQAVSFKVNSRRSDDEPMPIDNSLYWGVGNDEVRRPPVRR
jgi:TonB family protein